MKFSMFAVVLILWGCGTLEENTLSSNSDKDIWSKCIANYSQNIRVIVPEISRRIFRSAMAQGIREQGNPCQTVRDYLSSQQIDLVLSGLGMTDNQLAEVIEKLQQYFGYDTSVNSLDVSRNNLSQLGSHNLRRKHFYNLVYLDLSGNRLSNSLVGVAFDIFENDSEGRSLRYLDLSDNLLSGPFDNRVADRFKGLDFLDISGNYLERVHLGFSFNAPMVFLVGNQKYTVGPNFALETEIPLMEHFDVSGLTISNPDRFRTMLGRVGSLVLNNIKAVDSLNPVITADASMVEIKSTSFSVSYRQSDADVQRGGFDAVFGNNDRSALVGGCPHYQRVVSYANLVTEQSLSNALNRYLETMAQYCIDQ